MYGKHLCIFTFIQILTIVISKYFKKKLIHKQMNKAGYVENLMHNQSNAGIQSNNIFTFKLFGIYIHLSKFKSQISKK